MTTIKPFDKIREYIEAVFDVFHFVNKKSQDQKDRRLQMISLTIYNYTRKMARDNNINLNDFVKTDVSSNEPVNLIPIFEYISYNNIELYDFSKIDVNDVDVTKNEDLERFVLSHVYYITQKA
jgi:hypothetical protein